MPLLLFDLDNTLLPRDAAFRAWAQEFLSERDLPPGDIDWFVTLDGGGYVPRSTVLSAVRRRYGLDVSAEFLLAHYRHGINSHIHCPPGHVDALRAARAAGWTLGIVSNGGTGPQLEKIQRTGLGPLVDGWVISEEADCVKPDPLIFEIAARRCGVAPTGGWTTRTWMIGDHAPADIAGAELAGLRSVWLHHGRPWAEAGYRPTLKAAGLPEAVGQVLAARGAPSPRPGIRAGGPARQRSAGMAARATALRGARSGARPMTAAPDSPCAPVPLFAGTAGDAGRGTGPGTGSDVRNRSSELAVIAEARSAAGTAPGQAVG
ncbi:HAD-IA family hydrolase [Kitasatospora sp. NPDC097643]|uniref:HAD family hydrolase n=1 Tax=Kitasatospora sp. NPDC097643 TaxID=3157230 RepID=UPI003324DB1B